ncbi:MAG: hypothetical protein KAS38_20100, partial [Anaerolineales bacterium]|nr:hypothetical protein [Anaerolineales bacterium]
KSHHQPNLHALAGFEASDCLAAQHHVINNLFCTMFGLEHIRHEIEITSNFPSLILNTNFGVRTSEVTPLITWLCFQL